MEGQLRSGASVLMIVENLPVPPDRRVWQEACALRNAGYKVSVICPKGFGFESNHETMEGIEIFRHPLYEGSSPPGYLLEYVLALVAEFALALRIYCRTRFRLIHACNPPDSIFLIAAFFKLFGVRFVFDHHDLSPELYETKFARRGLLYKLVCLAERLTYRTADVAIATNESFREVAVERGEMPADRIFVVPTGYDLDKIQVLSARRELKLGRRFLALYLGMIGPQDGVDLFVEAAARIGRSRSDTAFVIIGGGSEVPRLKALVKKRGLESEVVFTGFLTGKDLAEYLSTADVCVAPDPKNALNDKLTMLKTFDYMAYGRPVVLFDLTEGRRALSDAALYARPNDPVDLAAKILLLLDNDSLRQALGERGRHRVELLFNWNREKVALYAAYEMALSNKCAVRDIARGGGVSRTCVGDESQPEMHGSALCEHPIAARSDSPASLS